MQNNLQKYKKLIPVVAVILLALGVNLDQFGIDLKALSGQGTSQNQTVPERADQPRPDVKLPTAASKDRAPAPQAKLPHWSNSQPEINLWHVFEGEINRKGKPTGFHSRPGGSDPANARVVSIKDRPNRLASIPRTSRFGTAGNGSPSFPVSFQTI